ncbi:MAG: hypothetical protein ACFFKA_18825 [Candidatus Thorarchaeota archaeon]
MSKPVLTIEFYNPDVYFFLGVKRFADCVGFAHIIINLMNEEIEL